MIYDNPNIRTKEHLKSLIMNNKLNKEEKELYEDMKNFWKQTFNQIMKKNSQTRKDMDLMDITV
jgi:hypothetical protein